MKKLNKELEKQVLELVSKDKIVDAVILVNNELSCGLKIAKDTVDQYRT